MLRMTSILHVAKSTIDRAKPALVRWAKDDSGQGTVEYLLLLSVVVVIATLFARSFLGVLDRSLRVLAEGLTDNLKSGRIDRGAWRS